MVQDWGVMSENKWIYIGGRRCKYSQLSIALREKIKLADSSFIQNETMIKVDKPVVKIVKEHPVKREYSRKEKKRSVNLGVILLKTAWRLLTKWQEFIMEEL